MVDPTEIARRSFRTTLRGFDQNEVRQYLAELAETLDRITAERDQLAATVQAGGAEDLKTEIELVSKEIQSVLESARSAAETMRERAAAETARWRSEALAEAEKVRREAQIDAEHLRTDAWTTSESLLGQVQREADRIRGETEKESLRLVGEAEREAHRTLGAGRREAEETIRGARMEAEKLVLDARASHDEIIETATRKAEVAQERTRALEERRDELRRELDSVRAAISAVESELDERREALGLTPMPPEPDPVEKSGEWVPGETVRVVRPGHSELRDEQAVSPSERPRPDPTPELRVLTPEELRSRQHGDDPTLPAPAPEPSAAEGVAPSVGEPLVDDAEAGFTSAADVEEVETEIEVDPQAEHQVQPEQQDADAGRPGDDPQATHVQVLPAEADAESPAVSLDDVEGLFARLREPVASDDRPAASDPEPDEQPSSPPTDSATMTLDPFEVRDELLLPIANRALRNVKRQLTEAQNAALEAIRLEEGSWAPAGSDLAAELRADFVVLEAESFGAGHTAAETYTSQRLKRPKAPPPTGVASFVEALVADLERAVADGRAHDHGARQLAADVSRVFRAWRTDEAERRVRDLAHMSLHAGLVASLPETDSVRWVVAGRGCATCRDHGERATVDELPPVHRGCACTVVPA
jgi:DivIVA domain-containing protein